MNTISPVKVLTLPVSYVPLGRDATYDDNGPNFRFKNTTQKSLLIYTEAKDGQLTIKFFGTPVGNQQIELSSETVVNLSSPVEITKDPSLPNGQRRIIHAGRDGFRVNVYKTIKQNGQIVERTLLSQDTYRAQPTTIVVGIGKTS
jgi:vancomycin resistance protein YoaR